MLSDLLEKSWRTHKSQKTLQRNEERKENNVLLRGSEGILREMGQLHCFNVSEISKYIIEQLICMDWKIIKR